MTVPLKNRADIFFTSQTRLLYKNLTAPFLKKKNIVP